MNSWNWCNLLDISDEADPQIQGIKPIFRFYFSCHSGGCWPLCFCMQMFLERGRRAANGFRSKLTPFIVLRVPKPPTKPTTKTTQSRQQKTTGCRVNGRQSPSRPSPFFQTPTPAPPRRGINYLRWFSITYGDFQFMEFVNQLRKKFTTNHLEYPH